VGQGDLGSQHLIVPRNVRLGVVRSVLELNREAHLEFLEIDHLPVDAKPLPNPFGFFFAESLSVCHCSTPHHESHKALRLGSCVPAVGAIDRRKRSILGRIKRVGTHPPPQVYRSQRSGLTS
jgi:hypothetical protein